MSYRLRNDLITAEENESVITIDYFQKTFSVYTTNYRAGNSLSERLPDYYKLAKDGASATANDVPLRLLTRLHLSQFK